MRDGIAFRLSVAGPCNGRARFRGGAHEFGFAVGSRPSVRRGRERAPDEAASERKGLFLAHCVAGPAADFVGGDLHVSDLEHARSGIVCKDSSLQWVESIAGRACTRFFERPVPSKQHRKEMTVRACRNDLSALFFPYRVPRG